MKRFVTYLYEYNQGEKSKNVGFIRVDLRSNEVQMDIRMRNLNCSSEKGDVYLLINKQGIFGINIGEVKIINGQSESRLRFPIMNIAESSAGFDDIIGIAISFGTDGYFLSNWQDEEYEEVTNQHFRIFSPKEQQKIEQTTINVQNHLNHKEESFHKEKIIENAKTNQKVCEEMLHTETNKTKETYTEKVDVQINKIQEADREKANIEINKIEEAYEKNTGIEVNKIEKAYQENTSTEANKIEEADRENNNTETNKIQEIYQKQHTDKNSIIPISESYSSEQVQTFCNMPQLKAKNQQFSVKQSFRKIELNEIRTFPSSNWYLCNNSFLLHGFFNYRYLVIKKELYSDTEKEKYYLGVPGVFERPEKVMAMLFGFPIFEQLTDEMFEQEQIYIEERKPEPRSGTFGCWFTLLDI